MNKHSIDLQKTIDKEREARTVIEKRLDTITNCKDSGIIISDAVCKIISVNTSFFDLIKFPENAETFSGKGFEFFIESIKNSFDNPKEFKSRFTKINNQKNNEGKDEFVLKNGITIELNYKPVFVNSNYNGHVWIFKEITLEKKYKNTINLEKIKYQNIINNSNLGLIEIDLYLKIISANERLLKMYNLSEEKLIGKKINELFPNKSLTSLIKTLRATPHDKNPKTFEIIVNNESGHKRYWSICVTQNNDFKGNLVSYIVTHIDVTHLKRMQHQKDGLLKRLGKNDKKLQEYADMVSHDLKTPLHNIDALALWLKEDYISVLDDSGNKKLDVIRSNVEKMEKLLNGILLYSSLDDKVIDFYDIDLNNLMKEILSKIVIPKNISIEITNKLPTIKGDKFRLLHLFENLITNAITYNDKHEGIIKINFNDDDVYWKFSIYDNGIGIEEVYLNKIFQIFQKIDDSISSTGIGLSIAKKIVEIYEGNIQVESEIGKGTKIHFSLKKF